MASGHNVITIGVNKLVGAALEATLAKIAKEDIRVFFSGGTIQAGLTASLPSFVAHRISVGQG